MKAEWFGCGVLGPIFYIQWGKEQKPKYLKFNIDITETNWRDSDIPTPRSISDVNTINNKVSPQPLSYKVMRLFNLMTGLNENQSDSRVTK